MSEKKLKKELSTAEKVMPPIITNPCSEILHRMNSTGIPITLNPAQPLQDCRNPEIFQVHELIGDTRIPFGKYKKLMDEILDCKPGQLPEAKATAFSKTSNASCAEIDLDISGNKLLSDSEKKLLRQTALFSSSKSYKVLKYATEKFINVYYGIDYGSESGEVPLSYIKLIEEKLKDLCCCDCPVQYRPLFAELIWNYWHEEGMVSLTMSAIANRFENKRIAGGRDPLANLVLDPLRPLSNLIWGYIQDKNSRLTPKRREFEYDHQYGITLFAGGGRRINSAETNSYFIQAFHNLLYKCSLFYKEADNLFRVPDAFPILNALREVHLLLAEAAGNQFQELTMAARAETMLEQYILARGEVREFLNSRIMVPYDEPWMDKVDTMKAMMGWPGASISYYHDLAEHGEKILLGVRWISWSQIDTRDLAKDWALLFRDAVQRYIHCYQAVTGVDIAGQEIAGADAKAVMPAVLLQQNMQRGIGGMRRR